MSEPSEFEWQLLYTKPRAETCDGGHVTAVLNVRFYIDPGTGQAHIRRHGVREEEAEEVLRRPIEDRPGYDGSRVAIGQTRDGRYRRVIYVADREPDSIFCITAYDLSSKALHALRRRRRRKP